MRRTRYKDVRDTLAKEILDAFGISVQDDQEMIADEFMKRLWPVIEGTPGIIGRDRALVDNVTKPVYEETHKRYEATNLRETRRGSYFEVKVTDPDGNWDGHVASITVELDRVEAT